MYSSPSFIFPFFLSGSSSHQITKEQEETLLRLCYMSFCDSFCEMCCSLVIRITLIALVFSLYFYLAFLDYFVKILDNERSAHGLSATAGYQPYVGLLHSGTADVDPGGGLRELQQAMGATDEEMAMLQQLGEGSWPLEDADIMDLDNQKSDNITPTVASMSTSSTPTNTAASTVVKLVEGTMRERTRGEEDGNAVSSVAMVLCIKSTKSEFSYLPC
jgi:hypothetical protein